MGAQSGVGPTAFIMLAVAVAVIAVPLWHARGIIRDGSAGTRAIELVFLAVLVIATLAGILPASAADVGWILVPLLVLLTSMLYASTFAAFVRCRGRVSAWRFAVFVLPLLLIATGSGIESVRQAAEARRLFDEPLIADWGFWSVFVLTVGSPLTALAIIVRVRARSPR